MKFLNFLPSTRLNRLGLLDTAIVLAFIPHLFLLKLPMLIYVFVGLVFIIKKKNSKLVIYSFMGIGFIAIALSFFAELNFSSFSKLLVFISLLISILSFAVILQRLTREINIYLLLSPSMLMILSFFFYNSIEMLFYALFTLFAFTFLLLYEKMNTSIRSTLRINSLLYLFALPIVVLLFLVFPRISYKDASFGFKGEDTKRTGHDGKMFLDSKALLIPSSKLVMEVSFEKNVPTGNYLYFRGSTLYIDKGKEWIGLPREKIKFVPIIEAGNLVKYNIKLYPHQQKWLYMLDLPLNTPKDSSIDTDYITLSKLPLYETFQYSGSSVLNYKTNILNERSINKALVVDKKRDPKTYTMLLKEIDLSEDEHIKAKKLLSFFSKSGLAYSLKPEPIDLEHPLDSFLLESKVGYCVHFASSFATAARLINIPSRIVTGYKADRSNAINNYLLVREADAHAWVELYLKNRGWVRFEPTATATRIITPDDRGLSNSYTNAYFKDSKFTNLIKQINIHYLYTRYLINTWVLQYDRNKQMGILKNLLNNTIFLLKFIASFLIFVLSCFILFILFQKQRCHDAYLCEMMTLISLLKKEGYVRLANETMYDFLLKIQRTEKRFKDLDEISALYHKGRYAKDGKNILVQLRTKISLLKKSLRA